MTILKSGVLATPQAAAPLEHRLPSVPGQYAPSLMTMTTGAVMTRTVAKNAPAGPSALRFATIRCRAWKENQRTISISAFAFSSPFFSMAAVTRESVAIWA